MQLTAAAAALRGEAGLPEAPASRTQRSLDAATAAGLGEDAVGWLWHAVLGPGR